MPTTYMGDGPDVDFAPSHKDLHPIKRRDGWTFWRRIEVQGRQGHVERIDQDGTVVVIFDDCRWRANVWADFEEGGQYYDVLWSDTPTYASRAAAYRAMHERFPVNPDEPFGDERYTVSPLADYFTPDDLDTIGWELCWGAVVSDEYKQGIKNPTHPADRRPKDTPYMDASEGFGYWPGEDDDMKPRRFSRPRPRR